MESSGGFLDNIRQKVKEVFGNEKEDKVFSSEQTFSDRATAEGEFTKSIAKLFDVDAWSNLPGLTSTFELYDQRGQRKPGAQPEVDDYIRIALPGPLPENWVKVLQVRTTEEIAEFTVSPSSDPNPKEEAEEQEVKHFFNKEATSTFRVTLKENTIEAFEIGKGEGINNKGEEAGSRAVVNTVVALGGWAGFQDIQWNKLTDYFVHRI